MKKKIKKIIVMVMSMALCIVVMGGTLKVRAADKPNLNIRIDDAPVLIEETNKGTISASYNPRYYKVDIEQSIVGNWNVEISVINSNTNKSVVLYIPQKEFATVTIDIDNGMFSGGKYNAECISANVSNGGIDFSVDKNFNGCIEVDAYNSIFHLSSLDQYLNFDVSMICDSESLGAAPSYFECDYLNGKYSYFNGFGSNVMNVSLRGGSVGSLE